MRACVSEWRHSTDAGCGGAGGRGLEGRGVAVRGMGGGMGMACVNTGLVWCGLLGGSLAGAIGGGWERCCVVQVGRGVWLWDSWIGAGRGVCYVEPAG